jgi:hypothetical protein
MNKKTVLGIIVWVLLFLSAMLDEVLPANIINSPGYILLNAAIVVLSIFVWFLEDAKEIGFTPSPLLKIGVVIFPVVAILYYRFKYTGFKKGVIFIVKIFGLLLLMSIFLSLLLTGLGYEDTV